MRTPVACFDREKLVSAQKTGRAKERLVSSTAQRILWSCLATAVLLAGCKRAEDSSATPSGSAADPRVGTAASPPVAAAPPFGVLHEPKEGETVATGPRTWAYGWCLDQSGIARVTVVAETGATSPVALLQPFPGVAQTYRNFPNADRAGFGFPIPALGPGVHTLTVTFIANNGGTTELQRHIRVK